MAKTAQDVRVDTPAFGIELEMIGDADTAVSEMMRLGFVDPDFADGYSRNTCGYDNCGCGEDDCSCCNGTCDCYSDRCGRLHAYHCDCSLCDYDRDFGLFAAQEDCTVSAEFVSRILRVTSPSDMEELAEFDAQFSHIADASNWHRVGRDAGNHIHVGASDRRAIGRWTGLHMGTFREQWLKVGAGGGDEVRYYNGRPDETNVWGASQALREYHNGSSWVSPRNATVEYRIWNSPRESGWIPFHVNMSLAMTRWASLMHDRHGDITVGEAQKVVRAGRPRRAFSEVALFLDDRVPGSQTHEAKLMDLVQNSL